MWVDTAGPEKGHFLADKRIPEDWLSRADASLTLFVNASVNLARAKALARCVDGLIIGTGQADFTQANTKYVLNHEGCSYQLIDAPGIEGHEERFTHLMAQAIAKAHLVFYVNGTNKKPEASTAKKIKAYLGRGAQVCPLVNVRGYADAYDCDHDRTSLEQHQGAHAALRQTEAVLSAALKPQHLMPGLCIQGLLGFSALSLDSMTGQSTIHPMRRHDLGVHQRKYLAAFGTAEAMRSFSRIDDVAGVLKTKAHTFREDIVEANKAKARELLASTIETLTIALKDHQAFMARVEPEISSARAAVERELANFSRQALGTRQAQIHACFDRLDRDAQAIVSEHFGDQTAIGHALEQAFNAAHDLMVRELESKLIELLCNLETNLNREVERLVQNLQRADFEQRLNRGAFAAPMTLGFDSSGLQTDLGMGAWGMMTLAVVSMAITGAQAGAAFPPWGVFIGASVGFVAGVALGVLGFFSSRPTRIRRAQQDVQRRMNSRRDLAVANATPAHDRLSAGVRELVNAQFGRELEKLHHTMAQPGLMVDQQIEAMRCVLRQLEDMPYGTVQAVRT